MMLITILVLKIKLELIDKIDDVITLRTAKASNYKYIGNRITYETAIWYVETIYNANFAYGIEIRISWQKVMNLMPSLF